VTRRARRRAALRCYAILGALAENGPTSESELCRLLHRPLGTLYPDLAALEHHGRVTGEWLLTPAGQPRRRLYRLTTAQERAATRALEKRLRAALHAVADPIQENHHG